MADPRHTLGRNAEDAVARWIERRGWRVIAGRHRSPAGGEVDLIALDPDGVLVAIEVRARRSQRAGAAWETVDQRRVRRLIRTLASVAASSAELHRGLRVDLVTVEPVSGSPDRWLARRLPGIG